MNKPAKAMNKPAKPLAADKPRRIRVTTLLNVGATFAAAVLVAAMHSPKLPPSAGD